MKKKGVKVAPKEKVVDDRVTNRDFMKDDHFVKACEKAGTPVTKRQASKFRRGIGKAYRSRKEV